MKRFFLTLALCGLFAALASPSFALTPAVNAKKSPSQAKMKACAEEYHARQIPKNGYKDFMKNCLKRKVAPAQP
jgi:hypothetical protein